MGCFCRIQIPLPKCQPLVSFTERKRQAVFRESGVEPVRERVSQDWDSSGGVAYDTMFRAWVWSGLWGFTLKDGCN